MIVVMQQNASESAIEAVISYLVSSGFDVHRSSGHERTILGVVGNVTGDDVGAVSELDGVTQVVRVSEPYRRAARGAAAETTPIAGRFGLIGGAAPWIAVELVGGNDRASTASFLRSAGLADRGFDCAVTRAATAPETVAGLPALALGDAGDAAPVHFVERVPGASVETWMQAAERWLEQRSKVVLLDAGDEQSNGTRSLDVVALARAKARTHLPIVVDVPRIAGSVWRCAAVGQAAIGAGADGVVLRLRVGKLGDLPRAPAALDPDDAARLADRLRAIAKLTRE